VADKISSDELLAKAQKPQEEAKRLHPFYRGKIQILPKAPIRGVDDFAIWYTPGVAEPSRAIHEKPTLVYDLTNKWNNVAVVTDGTRVLGLGDIGPEAALPVMEGKAMLFKHLGGVDAFPICLKTKEPEEIISAVKWLEPSFGGINLEDIAQPKCFDILERLRGELEIPVWHDDQQGTAAVTLAGLINALKIVGKEMGQIHLALIGAGAANIAIARILINAGVDPGMMIMCDSHGILHSHRADLKGNSRAKWEMAQKTNREGRRGGVPEAMKGGDVVISLSTPGPGTILKEWVASMAEDAIVFACANPIPEIWPWEAKEGGARIVATGRSDFPNQVNNSLGFPGVFRGALDVRARTITDEMCITAAVELARCAEEKGLAEDSLLPTMEDWKVYPRVAAAVGVKAVEQGAARLKLSREQLYQQASDIICQAREATAVLMDHGLIPPPPP